MEPAIRMAASSAAFDLAHRGGHSAQTEAAYREAIAGGVTEAWLYLGFLLSMRPSVAPPRPA
jgi:hypothetical protein